MDQSNLTATINWTLTNSTSSDGAILYGSSKIVPYYSNLAAIGLTKDPSGYAAVKAWMNWYIGHLNAPDKWGLSGTIYDYNVSGGIATSTNDADSTDSYAATFLSLAWAFYGTGDSGAQAYVASIAAQLNEVGSVLLQTQQDDGLTWAKPDYQIKYLMDNCEGYRGLRDAAQLFHALGDSTSESQYAAGADKMLSGIDSMWTNGAWAMYKDGLGQLTSPNFATWYPDATSQLFPVLMEVIPGSDARSQQVYTSFNNAWPDWPTLSYNSQDPFPWVLVGGAAALMGDTTRANTFIGSLQQKYVANNFPWPWYSAEAGWFMRLNSYMMGRQPF